MRAWRERTASILLALALLTPQAALAEEDADDASGASESTSSASGSIYILDAPYLSWNDIDADSMPNLYSLLGESGVSNLMTRSMERDYSRDVSANEAAACLASGSWAKEPSDLSVVEGAEDGTQLVSTSDGAFVSTLQEALVSQGYTVAAVGNGDIGDAEVRPAAIVAAGSGGVASPSYTLQDDVAVQDPDAPYGLRTDYTRISSLVSQIRSGSEAGRLAIAIDTGDLGRAGKLIRESDSDSDDESESDEAEKAALWWDRAVSGLDSIVGDVATHMEQGDVLIVYGSMSGSSNASSSDDTYAPLIIYGEGFSGLLHSSSTGRDGLAITADITATIYSICGTGEYSVSGVSALASPGQGTSLDSEGQLCARLASAADYALAIDRSVDAMIMVFAGLFIVSFLLSVLMLATRVKLPARALGALIPITRLMWIVTMAFPLATYLMPLASYDGITPETALAICCGMTLGLAAASVVFGRFTRWIYSMLALMALTIVVIAIDQLAGAQLAQVGYLTYKPLDGSRFFGIGNEGAGVLFGAWLLFCGLMLNRFHAHRFAKPFRRWGFPLLSVLILAVVVAPWWGANFGALVWGTVGTATAWWMFLGKRLTWKAVFATACACVLLTGVLIIADGLIAGNNSHLGAMADGLLTGGVAYMALIAHNMIAFNVATLVYSPAMSIGFAAIWIYLAWLRIGKPGPYKVFWGRNRYFKSVFTSAMIAALLMLVVEDSGILLPALVLLYATAGLTWLICDLHRWDLRVNGQPGPDAADEDVKGAFKIG